MNELFYIILINRHYRHEYDKDDFHLEKIFSKKQVLDIINSETPNANICDLLIITNDKELLSKFIVCINEDELKMLSYVKEFNDKEIRINKSFFSSFNAQVFENFNKIKNDEIVSANMAWTYSTVYPYDDTTVGIDSVDFEGWVFNKEFSYFETPNRYKKNNEKETFYLTDIKKGNIEVFKNLVNIDILEIGNEINQNVNWEFRNNLLRYYDKISCTRLYITTELLNLLRVDNNLEFVVETRLDKNHYIEYFITGVYKEYEEDYHDDFEREDNSKSYREHNGAYGFDDDTINSAFEGDPENYWNID